jgi:3-isopropylmalate/(R)-2-methylmalate dehydratase small subunit
MSCDQRVDNGESSRTVIMALCDDVSTDAIYPGRFMATVLPAETPQFAFADYPEFREQLRDGRLPAHSVVVAGSNFGCGSSREQAVSCLRGHDLCVVAKDFARIFLQKAVNLGLQAVTCPEIEAARGDQVEITGEWVLNKTSGRRYAVVPLPPTKQAMMDAGGLIPYTRQLLQAGKSA